MRALVVIVVVEIHRVHHAAQRRRGRGARHRAVVPRRSILLLRRRWRCDVCGWRRRGSSQRTQRIVYGFELRRLGAILSPTGPTGGRGAWCSGRTGCRAGGRIVCCRRKRVVLALVLLGRVLGGLRGDVCGAISSVMGSLGARYFLPPHGESSPRSIMV